MKNLTAIDVHPILYQYIRSDGSEIIPDLEKSEGSWLKDAITGRTYLDCFCQFSSLPLGWNHPQMRANKDRLAHAALHKIAHSDIFSLEYAEFMQSFSKVTQDFRYFFFISSGTLAVENAIKAAFDWKAQKLGFNDLEANGLNILHLENAYHGRSGYSLSLTNGADYKTKLYPKFNWERILAPATHLHEDIATAEAGALAQVRQVLAARHTAAILLEPIQGAGGDNHFRPEFFQALRQLADEYEAMLIFDEVQTGFGATGKWWCYQHLGIVPDMICFGKKAQVCGFASTTRIEDNEEHVFCAQSRIDSTWGGDIVDMARSTIVMEIIRQEGLIFQAANVGTYLLGRLMCETANIQEITNMRGRGLILAFDLPNPKLRDAAVLAIQEQGVLVSACGKRSIRLRPPLNFSMDEAEMATYMIRGGLKKLT